MPEITNEHSGKPSVAGFGGFGLALILQQLYHLDFCSLGPVIACGLIFGGVTQLIAGFAERKNGNNFCYAVFTAYGSFWIAYCLIQLFNKLDIYSSSTTDIGYFFIVWTIFTIILWGASLYVHAAMSFTFNFLVFGFILLDLAHFGYATMSKVAAYVFILGALKAWYMMAHSIFLSILHRDMLPLGDPWLQSGPAPSG